MVYVICFTDATQIGKYELSTLPPEEWAKANPNLHMVYAFKKSDELIYGSQCEKDEFVAQCGHYGFEASDYQRKFIGVTGDTLMLIGFRPQNRKYKCKLKNMNTGHYVKAAPAYVQHYMAIQSVS